MPLLLALLVLFSPAAHAELADFTTDGCSAFLDQPLFSRSRSWAHCCVAHDLAYWQGGALDQRAMADEQLYSCVGQALGSKRLALPLMIWLGVKMGGSPYASYNPFPWRWGYGWSQSEYRDLSEGEKREVAEKLSRVYQNLPRFSAELELNKMQYLYISAELYIQIVGFQRAHSVR